MEQADQLVRWFIDHKAEFAKKIDKRIELVEQRRPDMALKLKADLERATLLFLQLCELPSLPQNLIAAHWWKYKYGFIPIGEVKAQNRLILATMAKQDKKGYADLEAKARHNSGWNRHWEPDDFIGLDVYQENPALLRNQVDYYYENNDANLIRSRQASSSDAINRYQDTQGRR